MVLRSEESFKEYLKKLSDETIIRYYSDVEYSPFPILLIQEYTRRFEQKTKNQILKDLKYSCRHQEVYDVLRLQEHEYMA